MYKYTLDSKSPRLRLIASKGINTPPVLSFIRLGSLIAVVMSGTSVFSILLILLAFLCHYIVAGYMGYKLWQYKEIVDESDFIPLKKWMVINGDEELNGDEYNELVNEIALSTKGLEKLESLKSKGALTIYDYVNLMFFELQYGKPHDSRATEEELKKEVKDRFFDNK